MVFRGSVKFPPTNSLFGFKMSDFHLADTVITKVRFFNSPGENFLQILQRTQKSEKNECKIKLKQKTDCQGITLPRDNLKITSLKERK